MLVPFQVANVLCSQNPDTEIYRYVMFYAQSSAKGPMRVKQNVFLPQVKILIHYLIHNPESAEKLAQYQTPEKRTSTVHRG